MPNAHGVDTAPCLVLTLAEAKALYGLIETLSGYNPENVFAWDGTDSLDDDTTRAAAKLYAACGAKVPRGLLPGAA